MHQVQSRTGNDNRALCALQLWVTDTILSRIIKTGSWYCFSFTPTLIPQRPIMFYQPSRYAQFPSTQGRILAPQTGANTLKYTVFWSFRYLYKMIRRIQLVHQSVTTDWLGGGGKAEKKAILDTGNVMSLSHNRRSFSASFVKVLQKVTWVYGIPQEVGNIGHHFRFMSSRSKSPLSLQKHKWTKSLLKYTF